jgi:hypothetical protein
MCPPVIVVGTWFAKCVVWEMLLFAMIKPFLQTILIALFKSCIPISRWGRGRGSSRRVARGRESWESRRVARVRDTAKQTYINKAIAQ